MWRHIQVTGKKEKLIHIDAIVRYNCDILIIIESDVLHSAEETSSSLTFAQAWPCTVHRQAAPYPHERKQSYAKDSSWRGLAVSHPATNTSSI